MLCSACGYRGPFPRCKKQVADSDGIVCCDIPFCPRCGKHAFAQKPEGSHDNKTGAAE